MLNSIDTRLIADMRTAIAEVAGNPDARALLITGAGRGFCAGADLAAQGQRQDGMSIGQGVAHGMAVGFNPMMRELYALQKPIVAAVNGVAVGGGVGLALAADIVIAAKSASFVQVFGLRSSVLGLGSFRIWAAHGTCRGSSDAHGHSASRSRTTSFPQRRQRNGN